MLIICLLLFNSASVAPDIFAAFHSLFSFRFRVKKLDIWEQAFWRTKLYEHILKNMEKYDKLSYVFDVKGDKETFFKYLKKKFTSLDRKAKTTKATYYFLFLGIVITIILDLVFWRNTWLSFPFNLIYDLTLFFIFFINFEYYRRKTIKLVNSIKRIQVQ